jgi:hypothetical protein
VHTNGDVESLVKFHSPSARPTARVGCGGWGVDSVWEQKKLEARKMLENGAESHLSAARCVGCHIAP